MRLRFARIALLVPALAFAAPATFATPASFAEVTMQADDSVRVQNTAGPALTYEEIEPDGEHGSNDSADVAEQISGFGTSAPNNNRLQLNGHLSPTADTDYFAVQLRPGDTLGASVTGTADVIGITKPDGTQRIRSVASDLSFNYPPSNPLPRGGNSNAAYVAEEPGWYAVEITGTSVGSYALTLEVYRPGTESDTGRIQTVLIDFRGGTVDTTPLAMTRAAGKKDAVLSPLTAFLPLWGIPVSAQNELEDTVIATVRDNLQTEVQAGALNPSVNVQVLNARTNPELVGQTNVSQVYVAGRPSESRVGAVAIAQYVDPGNFSHEDFAFVHPISFAGRADPTNVATLNNFMNESSDRVKFVGTALGNVISHEIGHTLGLLHTDPHNDVNNIIDSGPSLFKQYGLGADGVGGTADDENIRFGVDTYDGLTGTQNAQNVVAWAYAGPK